MKAVVSNRIYLNVDKSLSDELKSKLTFKIVPAKGGETYSRHGGKFSKLVKLETVRAFSLVNAKIMSIPQGRLDLVPDDYELIDKRVLVPVPFPLPKFDLFPDQLDVYNEVDDSCFINAKPGWGKTFTALHIARKLGQKTLIITHTVALRDQWAQEVEKLYGIRPGVIGSGVEDVEDHAIVVSNIQTLNKLKEKYAKEFGLIIMDEAHHIPATTFVETLDVFHARYRIALSGTMLRRDGKHVLFQNTFGPKVIQPPKSNTLEPTVRIIKTGIMLTPGVPWVNKMNDLLYDEDYQQFIANIAKTQITKGHKVLITADRVEFLEKVSEYIGKDLSVLITGTGEAKDQSVRKKLLDEVEFGSKKCVVASRQIFTEGLSVSPLSCVILAVPSSNPIILEQLVGRIMRLHPDKLNPLVIDLHFAGYDVRKQNNERMAFYMEQGWKIEML